MKLWDFQSHDLNKRWWNEMKGRGIFAWEVGCGKTFSGAIVVKKFKEWNKKVLVVAPNSLASDWIENCDKAGVNLVHIDKGTSEFNITSYGKLKKVTGQYDLIIADECHRVKNPTSNRSKLFRKLSKATPYLLMMSGTMSNYRDPQEMLNYLWCINTDEIQEQVPHNITAWRNDPLFSNSYKLPGKFFNLYYSTKEGGAIINDFISKHTCIRRLREENEIPDFIEINKKVDSSADIKKIIERYEKELGIKISESYEKPHLIHELMLANGIDYDNKEIVNTAKFDAIHELLEGNDRQVIIWVWFREFGEKLKEYLLKKKYKTDFIKGGLTDNKRQNILNKFKDGELDCLIATQGTIAEGHNLQFCNYMITANQYFDVIKDTQARGRIERAGQKNKMHHVRLISKGSIEEYVVKVLKDKMSFHEAEDFLGGVLMKKYGVLK